MTLCPPELNDESLAESVVILMRYAAIREINLNTELSAEAIYTKSIAEVLEFQGPRMDCADESTPHEATRIYSSILEGGNVMQKFEESDSMGPQAADVHRDRPYPVRSEEDVLFLPIHGLGIRRRKRETLRDQYGESSSAASSEAHIVSDQMNCESTWGPCESAGRDKRLAQPYRLQQANKSDGQWSRWASDIRQLQPDQWSSSSSRWHSSAGYEPSWKRVSEWEGSKWSTPTRRTLTGSEYDTDQEWHLRSMRYDDGWAYDSTQSHCKRAKPTYTDPEDDRTTDSSLPIRSTSKTYDPRKRKDGGQDWSHSSSSSGQWRPRLRHEKNFSSAAGDTSDASNAVHRLGSIHETDGDAVKASSDRTDQWW